MRQEVTQVARAPAVQYLDDNAPSMIGSVLAERYQIIDRLGEGGMATVYRGEHMAIRKPCAIKVLHPEEAHKDDIVERFLQEARAASVIDHENVVEITDFGRTEDNLVFLVMELLDGEDLADMLARIDRIPWPRAKPILLQICDALAAAHDKGIIHRDMKPENCFRFERRGNTDFIKVLDFGIAKITSESVVGPRALTQTGMVFGTPEYMSPEQAEGRTVDRRTDIYSLGVILFQLLTGRVPFRGESPTTTLVKHLVEEPPVPSSVTPEAGIRPALDELILTALQKDPANRQQDMLEFAAALRRIDDHGALIGSVALNLADDPPLRAEDPAAVRGRSRLALLLALLLVAAVSAAFFIWREVDPPEAEPPIAVAQPELAPAPEPEPEPIPELEPETVTLSINVNTPATVIDPETGEELGSTDDDGGIQLVKGDDPRVLRLVAEGYNDTTVEVVPNADVTTRAKLKRQRKRKKGSKSASKPTGPVNPFPKR